MFTISFRILCENFDRIHQTTPSTFSWGDPIDIGEPIGAIEDHGLICGR